MTWIGIEAGEPAGKLGSVALLVIASGVWALTEGSAAAMAKRKRKMRRMVVELGGIKLVKSLMGSGQLFAEIFFRAGSKSR